MTCAQLIRNINKYTQKTGLVPSYVTLPAEDFDNLVAFSGTDYWFPTNRNSGFFIRLGSCLVEVRRSKI
jgi:hypothetical protein